jgi:type IV pilus assembly protein PilM
MAKIYAGLDIGSYEIKLVEVRKSGRQQIISQTAVVRTPMGSVERSQVLDVELVIDAVQSMLVESPLSTDKVVIGITSPEVVVKTVQMPLMPPKELEHALQFELPDIVRFPFESLKDITYSWEVLEKSERYQEILVVA